MEFAYKCAICEWGIFTNKEMVVKNCPRAGCGALIFRNTKKVNLQNADIDEDLHLDEI